jgi:signal transduction histidine kinase
MDHNFWDVFFLMLIYVPLLLIWGFSIFDIFRRDDLSGGWKALWFAVVLLIPFLGTLVYLLTRPPGATREERQAIEQSARTYAPNDTASQIKVLAELHDAGKLTDAEFASEKAKLIGTVPAGAAPA